VVVSAAAAFLFLFFVFFGSLVSLVRQPKIRVELHARVVAHIVASGLHLLASGRSCRTLLFFVDLYRLNAGAHVIRTHLIMLSTRGGESVDTLTSGEACEDLLDVVTALGAGQDVLCADAPGELLRGGLVDGPIRHVALVGGDHDRHAGQVALDLGLPLLDLLEAVIVRDVVHDQRAFAVSVVNHVERVIPLLACRVPNGEADLSLSVNLDFLLIKGRINRRLLLLAELTLAVLDLQRRLAHSS
jgi:hypothetical protein